MSGHSKWSKIKRKKGAADQKRGQLFSKIIREIMVAARVGGPNPEANIRLAAAVDRARAESMPGENIDRAIRRGAGQEEGVVYEEVVYEGYGPGGVALLIEAQTDNRNRATAAIRHILEKHGGSLGAAGCVAWIFKDRGLVAVEAGPGAEDRVIETALEAGALDVARTDDGFDVTTEPAAVARVAAALRAAGLAVASAEATKAPETTVPLRGEAARAVLRLVESLEAEDDVQKVHANFDISTEEIEAAVAS
jgi:YebC/PmpR family DNA-binding regulatory protein